MAESPGEEVPIGTRNILLMAPEPKRPHRIPEEHPLLGPGKHDEGAVGAVSPDALLDVLQQRPPYPLHKLRDGNTQQIQFTF